MLEEASLQDERKLFLLYSIFRTRGDNIKICIQLSTLFRNKWCTYVHHVLFINYDLHYILGMRLSDKALLECFLKSFVTKTY